MTAGKSSPHYSWPEILYETGKTHLETQTIISCIVWPDLVRLPGTAPAWLYFLEVALDRITNKLDLKDLSLLVFKHEPAGRQTEASPCCSSIRTGLFVLWLSLFVAVLSLCIILGTHAQVHGILVLTSIFSDREKMWEVSDRVLTLGALAVRTLSFAPKTQ
jgi:hypothetical protein